MYAATEMGPVVVIAWPRNCASGVDHLRSVSFAGGVGGGVGLDGADVDDRRSARCAAKDGSGRTRLHGVAVRSRRREWALMAGAGGRVPSGHDVCAFRGKMLPERARAICINSVGRDT